MGKQINYFMDYDSFVLVAKKAIELGCEIMKDGDTGIVRGYSTDLITKDCKYYYFHVPEAGEAEVKEMFGKTRVSHGYSAGGSTLIEAGYSFISAEKKRIASARLFCITGYYDETSNFIYRPDCVTKIYNALVRYVKKIAPYTEIEKEHNGRKYTAKEYIIPDYLALVTEQGYVTGLGL